MQKITKTGNQYSEILDKLVKKINKRAYWDTTKIPNPENGSGSTDEDVLYNDETAYEQRLGEDYGQDAIRGIKRCKIVARAIAEHLESDLGVKVKSTGPVDGEGAYCFSVFVANQNQYGQSIAEIDFNPHHQESAGGKWEITTGGEWEIIVEGPFEGQDIATAQFPIKENEENDSETIRDIVGFIKSYIPKVQDMVINKRKYQDESYKKIKEDYDRRHSGGQL